MSRAERRAERARVCANRQEVADKFICTKYEAGRWSKRTPMSCRVSRCPVCSPGLPFYLERAEVDAREQLEDG